MTKFHPEFERNVFINCPFDDESGPIFEAIVFAVHDAGFRPSCARSPQHHRKSLLIFDSEQYRFQKYVSDLAGQDIHQHGNEPRAAVMRVRDWLRAESDTPIPGGAAIYDRYESFRRNLPALCGELHLDVNRLQFVDFSWAITLWLRR